MGARLNNLSARLMVNKWLSESGRGTLGSELSYTEFATELRRRTSGTVVQVPFVSRQDAVAYIRGIASRARKANVGG